MVWLLLGKLIKVQPNPRKKTLLTTSFRSLGEVNCLPSAQPRLEAPERQGDRAPSDPPMRWQAHPATQQESVFSKGLL